MEGAIGEVGRQKQSIRTIGLSFRREATGPTSPLFHTL